MTQIESKPVPNYLVVPRTGDARRRLVECYYFLDNGGEWDEVKPDALHTNHTAFAHMRQPTPAEVQAHQAQAPDADFELFLFAAVAKTRDDNEVALANMIPVQSGAMTIPVYKGTKCSVILVFEERVGKSSGRLIATADPDISHSTDGL